MCPLWACRADSAAAISAKRQTHELLCVLVTYGGQHQGGRHSERQRETGVSAETVDAVS